MDLARQVIKLIDQTFDLNGRINQFDANSPLLGAVPELDSMGVVNLIGAIEDHFDITVDDDDINGDTFATLGQLVAFLQDKLQSRR